MVVNIEDYKGELLFEDVINDLLSIYKYFDKEKAHIIGLSMGGQIACLFMKNILKKLNLSYYVTTTLA